MTLDTISGSVVLGTCLFLAFRSHVLDAGIVGMVLTQLLQLSGLLQFAVRMGAGERPAEPRACVWITSRCKHLPCVNRDGELYDLCTARVGVRVDGD